MAAEFDGGVVIGADSRATAGYERTITVTFLLVVLFVELILQIA